jgi:hypothetical protein
MKTDTCRRLCLLGLFAVGAARAQLPVTEVRLRTDPAGARIRPYENLVVQVLAYGETSEGEQRKKVRLQKGATKIRLRESGGGWLSKPFRYQGQDDEPFFEGSGSRLRAILEKATTDFVLQDAVLYTAPERPGKYTIEVELEGKTAAVTIDVNRDAPSRRPAETSQFPTEPRSRDPYRRLAERYAPFIAQETWWQPKSDYLARFDLDGDWRGDNNWDHAERGSSQAYVHYAVMETSTHWFLLYNLFHPRDYSDKCVAGACHENDNEGLILTVEKDGSAFGRLQAMETLAHNNIYSYAADRRVASNAHNIDGEVELYEGSQPMVFVESGGHGIYGTADSRARFSARTQAFAGGTGVTYVYKGVAERPKHADDRNVGYDLLPIYDHWWLRSEQGEAGNPAFDAYYEYEPYGGRPKPPRARISGAFLGRKFGENKAKPFWGWHDGRTEKKRLLAVGQWGLDPAYGVTRNLRLPGSVSLDYVFNPYLGIGASPAVRISQTTATPRQEVPAGNAAAAAEFTPKRSDSYDPEAKRGRFDLRFYVDGDVEFDVRGDVVTIRSTSGRAPRDDGSEYSQPVPCAKYRSFTAEKKDGRGTVTLLEEPSPANDFTARLRITDPRGGEDRYHVRLEWEWSERVAPAVATAAQPAQPLPRSAETYTGWTQTAAEETGEAEFQGRVDGTTVFRIRGDRITAETTSGQPFQLRQFRLSRPLPASALRDIEVRKREGRGAVVLIEKPWEGNGYEAVVQVSDPMSGEGDYWFLVQWRR